MRPLRSVPCPHCTRNQVWSVAADRWRCPDCHWPDGRRVARDQAIDESRTALTEGTSEWRSPNRWRP